METLNKHNYKLVSFDIWGTLLKSNPIFVEARNILFSEVLGHDDLVHLGIIKDEVDFEMDYASETTGEDANFNKRLNLMMEKLQKSKDQFQESFFEDVRGKLNKLFLDHLPGLIEPKTIELFKELKRRGIKIAIISNTGFLHGDTMRPALDSLGVFKYVDFALFSNELNCAKPHPDIYTELLEQSGLLSQEIIHVGDSVKADYNGAWNSDIHSLLFDPDYRHGNKMATIHNINELLEIIENPYPVLHYRNFSLFSLYMNEEKIVDQKNQPFDLISYSKFKYGDGKVAREFGHTLAKEFIEAYPSLFNSNKKEIELIITTSPYKAIVKGSSGIVKGFKNYINQYLLDKGISSVVDIVILKKEMFQGDYGTFTDDQRKELMNKNDLYVMENLIQGQTLILIDDARITGSHEGNLVSFLKDKGIKEAFFLYIADMETSFAKEHPDVESTINHGWVDSLEKLLQIMNSKEFILNARVCKYILSQKDQVKFKIFLSELEDQVLYDLYGGIIGDGYGSMYLYRDSFVILKQEIEDRGIIL